MDLLYRQMRVTHRKSDKDKEGPENSAREGRIPTGTVSFNGEKTVSWFQTSGQMSEVEAINGQFAAAIAAAAYAISSLERREEDKEESVKKKKKKKPVDGSQTSFTKTGSTEKNSLAEPTDSSRISTWYSGNEEKTRESAGKLDATEKKTSEEITCNQNKTGKEIVAVPSIQETASFPDKHLNDNQSKTGKEMVTVASIRKTPTFTDKQLNGTGSKSFASGEEKTTGPSEPAPVKRTTPSTDDHKLYSTTYDQKEIKADDWQKAKIAKITKTHEKLYSRILEWESEKKKRAKRRSERKEGRLELGRKIALQQYNDEMARIDKIVARARAAANERKRIDEHKTMEKANEIRSTGKIPNTCLCI